MLNLTNSFEAGGSTNTIELVVKCIQVDPDEVGKLTINKFYVAHKVRNNYWLTNDKGNCGSNHLVSQFIAFHLHNAYIPKFDDYTPPSHSATIDRILIDEIDKEIYICYTMGYSDKYKCLPIVEFDKRYIKYPIMDNGEEEC